MNRPYDTYNGGKNGSGTYQAIINQIPEHEIYIEGFVGNGGVMANKRRAPTANIAIDLDAAVINDWNKIIGIIAINADSTRYITDLIRSYPQDLLSQIFVFLDPPYLIETRVGKANIYKHEMKDIASHKNLVGAMVQWPVSVCLSHYPCQFYDDALKGWRTIDYQGRTRTGMRTERLYMNYPPPQKLHDYRYLGNDFRERELYKKMQRNMVAKFKRMSVLERNFVIQSLRDKGLLPPG